MKFFRLFKKKKMIKYIPIDCNDKYEKIICKSIRIKKKKFFCLNNILYFKNISYIKIRKYNKNNPKIIVEINFSINHPIIVLPNILEIDIFKHNII